MPVKLIEGPKKKLLLILTLLILIEGCGYTLRHPFLVKTDLDGFDRIGEINVYNKENIFEYMNGEAENYFIFGFLSLNVVNFISMNSRARMISEIYDMGTSEGAQGIFSQYTQGHGEALNGMGDYSWTDSHIVLFGRGKYFIRIWPEPTLDAKEPHLDDLIVLGRSIDSVLEMFIK